MYMQHATIKGIHTCKCNMLQLKVPFYRKNYLLKAPASKPCQQHHLRDMIYLRHLPQSVKSLNVSFNFILY